MRLFNSSEAVERCDDKMLIYLGAFRFRNRDSRIGFGAALLYSERTSGRIISLAHGREIGISARRKKKFRVLRKRRAPDTDHGRAADDGKRFSILSAFLSKIPRGVGGARYSRHRHRRSAVAAMERRAQKGEFRSNNRIGRSRSLRQTHGIFPPCGGKSG